MIIDFLLDDIREAIADIQEDVSGLTETSFADVDYVASAKTIYFYNVLGEELGTIDTTDFVVDGMVDNVTLSGSILSITFNTDAGKETINIDLNDFINPEYYWTSAQTKDYVDSGDTAILAEVGELSGVVQEQQIVFSSGYNELHTQVMELSGRTVDLSGYYTSGETDEAIAEALTAYTPTSGFSTINGSAITDGSAIVIQGGGGDIAPLSAAVETLSAATAGKADAANVTARNTAVNNRFWFPRWNEQGIIVGDGGGAAWKEVKNYFNGVQFNELNTNQVAKTWYAPVSAGTAGEVLVSTGNGAPVWSAATFAQQSDLNTLSGATEAAIATIPANPVQSTYIDNIWKGTQAQYDALAPDYDPNTFYIIVVN